MFSINPSDLYRLVRRPRRREADVHFHAFTDDRAEVCHRADCSRPRLEFGARPA